MLEMALSRYVHPDRHGWPRPVITSIEVTKNPRHWRLRVWNRGGLAGELAVNAEDGQEFLNRLLGEGMELGLGPEARDG